MKQKLTYLLTHSLIFIYLLFFTLFFFFSCEQSSEVVSVDVSRDIVIPKNYIVVKNTEKIIIDGKDSEQQWQNVQFSDSFMDIRGTKKARYETKFKMMWDENFLYVFARLQEPHIWGNLTKRDSVIFYNNDFEVFINASGDGHSYGEIEINALGTVWDLYLNKPYRVSGKANNYWNLPDLKTAVFHQGTLNNPKDVDEYWSVEMAIPMKALIELKDHPRDVPKEGEQWRINFSRVQWDHDIVDGVYDRKKKDGEYLREYNWVWSSQKVVNMHQPEKWGFVQFTEKTTREGVVFKADKDLLFKQTLYALFNKILGGQLKEELKRNRKLKVKYREGKTVEVTFFKTNFGFECKLVSPVSNKKYIINEEGRLKTL